MRRRRPAGATLAVADKPDITHNPATLATLKENGK